VDRPEVHLECHHRHDQHHSQRSLECHRHPHLQRQQLFPDDRKIQVAHSLGVLQGACVDILGAVVVQTQDAIHCACIVDRPEVHLECHHRHDQHHSQRSLECHRRPHLQRQQLFHDDDLDHRTQIRAFHKVRTQVQRTPHDTRSAAADCPLQIAGRFDTPFARSGQCPRLPLLPALLASARDSLGAPGAFPTLAVAADATTETLIVELRGSQLRGIGSQGSGLHAPGDRWKRSGDRRSDWCA